MRTRVWGGVLAAALAAVPARGQEGETGKPRAVAAKEEKEDEAKNLPERVSALEKELAKVKADAAAGETGTVTYSKDGFRFRAADGNYEGHIGGRVITHARFAFERLDAAPAAGGPPPNTFFLRETYLQFDGTFYKEFEYKIQANFFTNGGTTPGTTAGPFASLSDCYVGWKPIQSFGIRVGQMEVPISQEEICSALFLDFNDRSVMNRLVPTRDAGVEVYGALFNGIVEYEAGFFNGQLNGTTTRNIFDNNDEKDLAGRLRVSPFRTTEFAPLKQLTLGVAGTTGQQVGSPVGASNALADLTSVETGTRFVDFAGTTLNDDQRWRIGTELAYAWGPFGLQAEYVHVSNDAVNTATGLRDEITEDGYYVQASYILTGEAKKPFARIAPAHPFSLGQGGWGAFEVAARIAGVKVNDLDGFDVAATGGNDRITAYTTGVNWWMQRNVRCSLDYIHDEFGDDLIVSGHNLASEDVLLFRFQIDF